jgi:signal transduction histidine kinase/HAMP domain-containing protein
MRWWLSFAFALIAAVTAAAVAQFFAQRSEAAFRERAQALAVGTAVAAAETVARAYRELDEQPQAVVRETAERQRLSLFVFDGDGRLLTRPRSRATDLVDVPDRREALDAVDQGGRYVDSHDDGRVIVIGLRLRNAGDAAALVAYAARPELAAEVAIARDKVLEAALIAVGIGVAAGLLVAMLIAARLRRIARAAAAIEAGSFDEPLEPGFRDELGALAATVDRMRVRLRDSFASIQADRDRLHTLLARLREGVLTVDEGLHTDYANPTAERLLGMGTLERGAPLPDPWPGFSLRALAAGLFSEGAEVAEARVVVDEDATVAVVGVPAGPGTQTAILVLADVSERERRERAEREFVTNAAHELRTPLAAIASAVEVLQSGAKEERAERDRFLASIERQSARLGRLAHTLLTLARAQTRPDEALRQVVPVLPLLDEVAAGLTLRPGVEVRVESPRDLAVLGDRDLLQQALGNLAGNAAKHTEEGSVELSARPLPTGAVVLEVRDTGPGMDPVEQERAFERFYQGSEPRSDGFGLGLAIVRQAVRSLGGSVELESAPGQGTTARIVVAGANREAA